VKKIKLPSLQHVARQWAPTSLQTAKNLELLALSAPPFSYDRLYSLVRGLAMNDSLQQTVTAVERAKLHPSARSNYLEILPLADHYFREQKPDFVIDVAPRQFPVGKDLHVPFKPPLIFYKDNKPVLPWFVFWRSQPLAGENLRLFVTLVREMMRQDPDLEEAEFPIIDFSSPQKGAPRGLTSIDSRNVVLFESTELKNRLEILIEGYEIASARIQEHSLSSIKASELKSDTDQLDLFGGV
jgi:hypothetical protein